MQICVQGLNIAICNNVGMIIAEKDLLKQGQGLPSSNADLLSSIQSFVIRFSKIVSSFQYLSTTSNYWLGNVCKIKKYRRIC